jgi:large subunit ribosomal protein L13
MIINAENLILGRLASFVAKQLLLGETINIVNCEKVLITGSKKILLEKYKRKVRMGTPEKGPFFPRIPHLIVKRTIRGMLPYKQEKGLSAFKRVKCYLNIPEQFQNKQFQEVPNASISKSQTLKYFTLKQICELL